MVATDKHISVSKHFVQWNQNQGKEAVHAGHRDNLRESEGEGGGQETEKYAGVEISARFSTSRGREEKKKVESTTCMTLQLLKLVPFSACVPVNFKLEPLQFIK